MLKTQSWMLAGAVMALALSACASTGTNGVAAEPSYIASVAVIQHDAGAPPAFADTLHDTVLAGAAYYGATGRPLAMTIDLDRVHFKNAVQAMIIGDDNILSGHVAVVDASGAPVGNFPIRVDAERKHAAGGGIVLGVLEMFDPTGIAGIADAAGHAASADINRSGTAQGMRANFADEALRQTFGDTRTRAVILAHRDEARAQAHARPR